MVLFLSSFPPIAGSSLLIIRRSILFGLFQRHAPFLLSSLVSIGDRRTDFFQSVLPRTLCGFTLATYLAAKNLVPGVVLSLILKDY